MALQLQKSALVDGLFPDLDFGNKIPKNWYSPVKQITGVHY
jgi:hypothetical protein